MSTKLLGVIFIIAIACGTLAGCSRTLRLDEYVPFVLDDLEAVGVFEDSPVIVLAAIKNATFPPSWRVDGRDVYGSFHDYPPSVNLGPFVHPHDRYLWTGSALITPIVGEEQSFEIRIWVVGGSPMLSRSGYAIIRATGRYDAHVVAFGKTDIDVRRKTLDQTEQR